MTGTGPDTAPRPAGFWIRALAALVDVALFGLVQFSFALVGRLAWGTAAEQDRALQGVVTLFTLVFTLAYSVVLHAVAGQTIGKLLVGIRVLTVDGGRVPPSTALLRYLACYVSLAVVGLGFVMAGLRVDRRALHDLLAGTRVERWGPARAPVAPAADRVPVEGEALASPREPPG